MGPLTLFDKSFLQCLSADEAVWFDHFFMPVVCPLFYVETLADLAKKPRTGMTAEEEVGRIARKFPEAHGTPVVFHLTLWMGNLEGARVPMNGQVPVANARRVRSSDKTGEIVEVSPEAEAFQRWSLGEFSNLESSQAIAWRTALQHAELSATASLFESLGINASGCKTLKDIKNKAREYTSDFAIRTDPVRLCIALSGANEPLIAKILKRHEMLGRPRLSAFAPYADFACNLEVYFQLAVMSNLISGDRASNRIDMGYLFYLPFCHLFVSSDRLHERCAPHFLREDQQFIWGPDLKQGLSELNDHYRSLPIEEREKGISAFALFPPEDNRFLVTRIFDSLVPRWRDVAGSSLVLDQDQQQKLLRELKALMNADEDTAARSAREPDFLALRRSVKKKKGSWFQLPKDFKKEPPE